MALSSSRWPNLGAMRFRLHGAFLADEDCLMLEKDDIVQVLHQILDFTVSELAAKIGRSSVVLFV